MASAVLKSVPESLPESDLFIDREDIRFWNKASDRVVIEIKVRNQSTERSNETTMLVQSAPLGAFVPWQPVAHVAVPAIAAGETGHLATGSYAAPGAGVAPASADDLATLDGS
jgi:hypothetical protein